MPKQPGPKPPGAGTQAAYSIPSHPQARALHALSKGDASAEQQKIAFNWILKGACGLDRDPFVPGQPDVTHHLTGRLSVARQVGWVLGQSIDAFKTGEID